jgi:hypothetical protein
MPTGTSVALEGMTVTVTAQTPDQRIAAARFRFNAPLEDARFRFLCFLDHSYRPCMPPAVGESLDLEPATLSLGW